MLDEGLYCVLNVHHDTGTQGWHYDNKMYEVYQNQSNETDFGKVYIRMRTGAMYNDYYDNHYAYINPEVKEVEVYYSGVTECMCCGKGYEADHRGNVDAFIECDKVVCANCEVFAIDILDNLCSIHL